ncbi:energy-dependent translational throttle protein EttA [Phocaeicola sp.]
MTLEGKTVLLGVTGSIAAYKIAYLASALKKRHADVHVLMTENATNFINPITFETLTGNKCLVDTFDRNFQFQVEHVSIAKKADVVMIAPASANVIGKLAHGIADDMLTTTIMACKCKKFISPAMNTNMFENPVVQDNLKILEHYGYEVIAPACGYLACGDTGAGKMPEPETLLAYIEREAACEKDLKGKKILVTAGPTQESVDPVRYLTNHSSGKMGYAIAKAAMLRGADVTLILYILYLTHMATVDDKKIIFSMVGLNKTIQQNNKQVLKNIYLSFFYGAKIGIIGLNGSGKSTLLKIIAGLDKSYQGEVVFSPGYSVGYLAQEPYLDPAKTVKEVVMEGVQPIVDALAEYEEINQKFGLPEYYEDQDKMDKLFTRQAELQDIIDATDAWNLDSKLERAMDALRCPPEDQSVEHLSGGERRRVALCRLLLQKPDILLLDEPTNHLDAESIDWLEQHLQQYEGTVIAVTHDRYFLDHVAGWILELDRGEGIPWKGNYSSWLEQKTKRMEQEEKTASKRRKTLERELEWVRMAPKARQAKGKARLNSYDKLLNEDVKEKEEKLEIFIPNGPRLGNKVIEAKHVAKAFGDKLLFDDLNFMLPPNGIVGIIGPNGAGKTTLFRLIMGLDTPDSGEFEVGETVKVAYVDQQHKDIDPNKSVYQVISGGNDLIRMGGRDINARAYLSRFNFSGADQEKLCGVLSGGERNRLHLALCLKEEGNVLLLDEPTNDIDVNTLRALEEGLEDFAGCAVVISHDRWFLDRICTHILAFEGDSNVFFFEGSYSEYEENKLKRLGKEEPTRVRYRKLMND